jgi:hypothetical protein
MLYLLCFLERTEHRSHSVLLPICTGARAVKSMCQIALEWLYETRIPIAAISVHIITNIYCSHGC